MKKIIAIALCLLTVCALSVSAFADNVVSPTAETTFHITLQAGVPVDGISSVGTENIVIEGNHVTVTPDSAKGEFNSWTIYRADDKSVAKEGVDYVVVKGSLNEKEITIEPQTDLIICGNYDGKITDPATGNPKQDTSPKTGESIVLASAVAMLAAAAVVFGSKKISK